MTENWFLYILECKDKTLYTGITKNLNKRINQHAKGIGAKYTRGRGPFRLAYKIKYNNLNEALKKEYEIKQLTKLKKLELINNNYYNLNKS
ncbi:GIY-YIG nuclease family protein [Alphaproteobacteria bacterium]|nr:GIY-YIG nuclease family protein [Alphaproteobacteria bacterium]